MPATARSTDCRIGVVRRRGQAVRSRPWAAPTNHALTRRYSGVGAGHARDREVGRVSYRCGVSPGAGCEVAAMGRSYKSRHGTVFGAGRGLGVTKRFSW